LLLYEKQPWHKGAPGVRRRECIEIRWEDGP